MLSWAALALIGAVRHGMFWRAQPLWTHLATYASVMFVAALLLVTIGGRADRTQLRAAFWFLFLLVGGAIGLVAPGGIIFFLFPPLILLVGIFTRRWWRPAEKVAALVALLFLYFTWGAMLGLLEDLLNGGPMWIFAPLASLFILPVLIEARPLIAAAGLRAVTAVAGTLTVLGWAAAAIAPAYSADRQQRFVVEHVTDTVRRKAYWSVLNDRAPLPAAYRELGDWKWSKLPYLNRERWLAAAPVAQGIAAPTVDVTGNLRTRTGRTVTLRLRANGAERVTIVGPKDAQIRSAGLSGFVRPIDRTATGEYQLTCFGRSCDGVTLQFTTSVPARIGFTLVGSRSELPPEDAQLLAGRPKFARAQYVPDQTVTLSRIRL